MSQVIIWIRPTARARSDPMLLMRFGHDYRLLQTIQATMPDWYITWYGRAPQPWNGQEIFYAKLVHGLRGLQDVVVSMEFLFEVTTDAQSVNMAVVIASRKDVSGTNLMWVLNDYAMLRHYPMEVEIKLVIDIPYRLNYSEC